jgi:dual specificity phosphatase 12
MLNTIFKYLNLSNDYDLILPNLYIGNKSSSQDLNFIKEHNIDLIINCSKNLKFIELNNIKKIRIPIDDNRILKNNDILEYLECLDTIEKFRKEKKSVLVHCHVGSQRSATILLLYLIKKLGYSYEQGLNLIKLKRPICFFPFNNFDHVFETNSLTFS